MGLIEKLELIRYGYVNASANNEARNACNSVDSVIRDVDQLNQRIEDLELALSEISALRKEYHDKAGYIAVAALNKDK